VRYSYNDLIEQFSCPLDHIEVTVGYRIETAGINRAAHGRKFGEECEK
jgi:hypothetical protein